MTGPPSWPGLARDASVPMIWSGTPDSPAGSRRGKCRVSFPSQTAPAPSSPAGAVWSGGPYSPAAPAQPGRRRLSGLSLVAICVAAVVVLAGAGIGTWLAVRDGGGTTSGTTGGNGETPVTGEVRVEKLSLAGRVVLPEGAALSPADLAVLSDTSEASCSTDGAFKVSAVHDQGARTALLVVNANRNPVLMAVAASSTADLEPSVASTARALVLYDPAFLSLPKAAYDLAAERLESHPGLPDLESALSDALRSDPSDPARRRRPSRDLRPRGSDSRRSSLRHRRDRRRGHHRPARGTRSPQAGGRRRARGRADADPDPTPVRRAPARQASC